MAGERTLPNLGLTAFYDLGDSTWKPGMDTNIQTISVLLQGRALSVEATEPGSPSNGDVYIASGIWGLGNPGDIIFRDDDEWFVITPAEGWLFYLISNSEFIEFDGADWVTFSGGAAGTGISHVEFIDTPNALTDAHLEGNVVIIQNSETADSEITVDSSLTADEPVTIINLSGGTLTISAGAGVTIHAANDVYTCSTEKGSVTIIPAATADTYYLIGALDAPAE